MNFIKWKWKPCLQIYLALYNAYKGTLLGSMHLIRFCGSARNVMKVDDDVLLNVDLLAAHLQRRNLKRSIMGHVFVKG